MARSMIRFTVASLALLAVGGMSQTAVAGPTWPEDPPDAGSLPGTAQIPFPLGGGPLTMISGRLSGPTPTPGLRGPGDFEDMYLIQVTDPLLFFASTDPADGGFADFNTELFLFTGPDHPDGPGLGMFANDDNPGALNNESRITGSVTDGSITPAFLPGLHYYLAVTGFVDTPTSGGLSIFDQALPTEISGPDGPGGFGVIDGWSKPGEFGDYQIVLEGVSFPKPSPGAGALFVFGAVFGASRRRR